MILDLELRSKTEPHYGWHPPVTEFFDKLADVKWDFNACDYKLAGIDYSNNSTQFLKEIEKRIIWEKLIANSI